MSISSSPKIFTEVRRADRQKLLSHQNSLILLEIDAEKEQFASFLPAFVKIYYQFKVAIEDSYYELNDIAEVSSSIILKKYYKF